MRESRNTWRKMHMERIRYLYGENYRRWKGMYKDDRERYCDLYESMEAALRSLPAEPLNYVAVAMDAKLRQDRETMDRIAARFKRIEKIRQASGEAGLRAVDIGCPGPKPAERRQALSQGDKREACVG